MNQKMQQAAAHFNAQPNRYGNAAQWRLSLGSYRPAEQENVRLFGNEADAGQFDDDGTQVFGIAGGQHHGHVVTVRTAKHNCGAYSEMQDCSCGQSWCNSMHGCWQYGHQREEQGSKVI